MKMKSIINVLFVALISITAYSFAIHTAPGSFVVDFSDGATQVVALAFIGLGTLLAFGKFDMAGLLAANGLVLTEVIAMFDKYYKPNGEEEKRIREQLRHADDIGMDFMNMLVTEKYYEGTYLSTSESLQAFYKGFVPKGSGEIKPWRHKVGEFKIDDELDPDDYDSGWASFLIDLKEVDRSKWPLIRWYIDKVLMPQAQEDYLLDCLYWGWEWDKSFAGSPIVNKTTFQRQLTSSSAATPANASVDGLHTQMAKMISAGRLSPITMGAVPTDEVLFVTYVETFVASIPAPLRRKIKKLYMNDVLSKRFRTGMNEKYNSNYKAEDIAKVWDENIIVHGTVIMTGSNQIFGTTPENMKHIIRSDKGGRFDIQKEKRTVNLLTDWQHAHILETPEVIATTDQDATITNAMVAAHYDETPSS